MPDFPYTLKQIAEITGKSNTALFAFIKDNNEFINCHSQKNGRFVKYDEDALQSFIKRFGQIDKEKEGISLSSKDPTPEAPETPSSEEERGSEVSTRESVVEAFEAQIEALKAERDALSLKLEQREKDCAEWRAQAGQALSALSKEQDRVERLEERLAGYLPSPPKETENATSPQYVKRKLTFSERIKALFGHELEIK